MTKALLLPREAAEQLGVSTQTVKAWMRRAVDPLPSVVVGKSGRNRKVVAASIASWLVDESQRRAGVPSADSVGRTASNK